MALNHELQNVARLVQERCLQDFWAFQPLTCMTSLASCPTPSFSLSSGSSIKSEPKSGNSIESSLKFGAGPSILTNLPLYWLWTLSRWHHHLESILAEMNEMRNQWAKDTWDIMNHDMSWHKPAEYDLMQLTCGNESSHKRFQSFPAGISLLEQTLHLKTWIGPNLNRQLRSAFKVWVQWKLASPRPKHSA